MEERARRRAGVELTTPTATEDWGTNAMFKAPAGNEFWLMQKCAWLAAARQPLADEPRRSRREGHDRDHWVHARRGRQEASIADPQIPHIVRLARRFRSRCPRVGSRPSGTHRMGGEQGHSVLSNAQTA